MDIVGRKYISITLGSKRVKSGGVFLLIVWWTPDKQTGDGPRCVICNNNNNNMSLSVPNRMYEEEYREYGY